MAESQLYNQEIIQIIKNRRVIGARQARLESRQRREGRNMPVWQLEKLWVLSEQSAMIDSWLEMLSEDEAYVVRRHLIDGIDWPRIADEYDKRWGEYTKTQRTLMRYQKSALEKIQSFMEEQDETSKSITKKQER